MKMFAQTSGLRRRRPTSSARGMQGRASGNATGCRKPSSTRIEAEGVERNWPPLQRILMSLDPIFEAGPSALSS